MSNPKDTALDIVQAIQKEFKKSSLSNRRKAWKGLTSKEGSKEIDKLILHPNIPLNNFKKLSFKEWVEIREKTSL